MNRRLLLENGVVSAMPTNRAEWCRGKRVLNANSGATRHPLQHDSYMLAVSCIALSPCFVAYPVHRTPCHQARDPHSRAEKRKCPSLETAFPLLIPSAAGPKTILNLCCIGQLVYAQSPLLAVLRIEVVNNGSAEAIKIVIAGLPIQGVRPFCFLIESAKVRITLVSSRRELASEIVVHITTAYNGQHERWKPAAPDHRTVPDINGWLPSAPCCR